MPPPFILGALPNTCSTALQQPFYFGAAARTSIILLRLGWCFLSPEWHNLRWNEEAAGSEQDQSGMSSTKLVNDWICAIEGPYRFVSWWMRWMRWNGGLPRVCRGRAVLHADLLYPAMCDVFTLASVFMSVVFVCDDGEGGGVSQPAFVRVPLEAWSRLFLWWWWRGLVRGCWRMQEGVNSRSSNAVFRFSSGYHNMSKTFTFLKSLQTDWEELGLQLPSLLLGCLIQ